MPHIDEMQPKDGADCSVSNMRASIEDYKYIYAGGLLKLSRAKELRQYTVHKSLLKTVLECIKMHFPDVPLESFIQEANEEYELQKVEAQKKDEQTNSNQQHQELQYEDFDDYFDYEKEFGTIEEGSPFMNDDEEASDKTNSTDGDVVDISETFLNLMSINNQNCTNIDDGDVEYDDEREDMGKVLLLGESLHHPSE